MCRFHSKIVYELPIMSDLEYYLRLDTHSYLPEPISYDLFLDMKERELDYLYPCIASDVLQCVDHLWDAVKLFLDVKRIQPYFYDKLPKGKIFFNNFEMARMDLFTSLNYKNYINYIDQLGGIYHNRWGDAPIKSLAISVFVPRNKTRRVSDIVYYHRDRRLTKGDGAKYDWCDV